MTQRFEPLSDEEAQEAVDAYREHGSKRAAAKALGISRPAFQHRIRRAAERGLMLDDGPPMPGWRISRVSDGPNGRTIEQRPEHGEKFEMPATHVLGKMTVQRDAEGRTIQDWIRAEVGKHDPAALVEWIKEAFADIKPARPVKAPKDASDDLLTLIPLADWHIGMFAWGKETVENWDLKIAERVIGETVDNVIAQSTPSGTAVVLGGGDLIHSDSNENRTRQSGNNLQVDGRYQKVVMTACRLIERVVDQARRRHGKVIVRILPGNHDEHASVAVAYAMLYRYRDDPRVEVDVDPSVYWWLRFGNVLLGATHGHTVRVAKMPGIMAQLRAEDWGATRFRYVHSFHLHHSEKLGDELHGVVCEVHRAPIPPDAWHFGSGYLSGRSIEALTYHREFGYRGRVVNLIMDGASNENERKETAA